MKKVFSRKLQRKQERLEKKQKKNLFFQKRKDGKTKTDNNENNKSPAGMAEVEKTKRKRKRKNNGNSKMAKMDLEREKKFIDKEEKEIKKYEKLLKLKSYTKRNKLPKSFYYDGLGELLEFCDNKQYSNRVVTDEGEEDAFAELRNRKPKQVQPKAKAAESDHEEDDDDDDDDSFDEEDEEIEMDEADEEVEDEEGEAEELSDNDEEGQDDDFENEEEEEEEEHEKPKKSAKKESKSGYREDIYGFLRDKDGNIVKSEAEQRFKEDFLNSNVVVEETLQRKLRGLVNRLTANNIKVISNEILALYKGHSRAVINQGILNVFDRVIIKVDYIVPVKLVAEMAMLVAILHSEIGEEVGAFFIHSAVRHFDALFSDTSTWNDTKQLNNTVIFILNLYTAGLVDSVIVYDIIDKFCEQFSQEKSIEIINLMLKASGFQLRKDDTVRMKSLIMAIQQLSSSVDQSGLSGTRIRFVLESLTAIKNNNMAKLKVTEPVVMGELIESTLKGVIKKPRVQFIPGQYATVIQSAHWFSFTANIVPLEAIKGGGGSEEAKQEEEEKVTTSAKSLDKLVDYRLRDQLCKKLRINTPLRRDLFTALFACNDYLDAACKLVSIGKKQFSEVVNVVLHVAVNEKTYNPFYYHLLQHLTTCDRKYKLALDFAVRDKIEQVETMSTVHRNTFAKLLFNLLKGGAIAITCLKVVQFSDMNEVYVDFIRKVLEPLFSQCDDSTVESVFTKIPKKDNFASAIKLFISCFMSADSKSKLNSVRQFQLKMKI